MSVYCSASSRKLSVIVPCVSTAAQNELYLQDLISLKEELSRVQMTFMLSCVLKFHWFDCVSAD